MIFDSLNNIAQYTGINKNLDVIIRYLQQTDLNTLPLGKTEIDDVNYVIIFDNTLTPGKVNDFEMHREYGDLHITLTHAEQVHVATLDQIKITQAYDPAGDAAMGVGDSSASCRIDAQHFVIAFPNDAHSVKNHCGYDQVKKAVLKFKI